MAFLRFSFLLACVFCTGCSHVSYLLHVGLGQLALYNDERSIEKVLKDPDMSPEIKAKLKQIPEMKAFVERELGVKATSNYTTYVDLKRPYVIWSLTIAARDELKVREWNFPIVGSFPYLGFFNEEKAKQWQLDAEKEGMDTYVRGVSAYSTLGYLRDPFLSSMFSRNDADLANLIFHETTHTLVYLKSQGGFNEEVASFIGDYGERHWIVKTFGEKSVQLKEWEGERLNRRVFAKHLVAFSEELKKIYAAKAGAEAKSKAFAGFHERLRKENWRGAWKDKSLEKWILRLNNNAALLAYLTYEDHQELYDEVYACAGRDVKKSLSLLQDFAKKYTGSKSTESPQTQLTAYIHSSTQHTCAPSTAKSVMPAEAGIHP